MWLAWIWSNRQLLIRSAGIISACLVVWWFGFHIPAVAKDRAEKIVELEQRVKAGERAITLLAAIQERKAVIDEGTNKQIAELQQIIFPCRTTLVFLPAGRLSIPMQPGRASH